MARRLLVARKPNPFGPSAWGVVGFALFFWASVTWFAMNVPDWMLCYFVPASTLPMVWVHGVFALCLVLAALSGHTLTAVLLQAGRTRSAIGVLISGALCWFSLWAFTLDRYLAVGTHEEWLAGTTVHLQQSSIVGAMNTVGALQGLAGALPLLLLFRAGRRLRAR